MCEAGNRLFRTLEEAAEVFGISPGEVSKRIYACEELGGGRARWADRVYAVKMKDRRYVLCVRDVRDRLVRMDDGERLRKRDIEWVRDITVAWYYPKEEW